MESRTVLPPVDGGSVLADLAAALDEPDVALVGQDGATLSLPDEVRRVLKAAVDAMSQGLAVTVEAHGTELTVPEAADLLGMGRLALVRLLDLGRIPFEHRGQQRVVRLVDVVDYQERVRVRSRASLDELSGPTP